MFYKFIKPILFSMDAEDAHNLTLHLASLSPALGKLAGVQPNPKFSVKVGHTRWTFPVGLAAGLDKNAEALSFFDGQGFGAIECGTITLMPQSGNPRPRMFRYPKEQSLRNSMGFPNQGMLQVMPRLNAYEGQTPLGINIGKNKDTTPEESINELSLMFETLHSTASYFVINVSSPNTPGLRALQEKAYLSELFTELNRHRGQKDLFLKIAPDLSDEKIIELTQLANEFKLTGLIATNTTMIPSLGIGGVSGDMLKEKSNHVQKLILQEKGELELIAVGGISGPKDLFDLWSTGGKVVQVYSSYVFQGPELLKNFYLEMKRFTNEQKIDLEVFFKLSLDERKYRMKHFKY